MTSGRRKVLSWILCLSVLGLICLELGVRIAGLTDFPIYVRMSGVEYELVPNQSGRFVRKNYWYVNSSGFDNEENVNWKAGCFLLGDSVVYGGNPVNYKDRVGYLAAQKAKKPVWVGAAGGWNLINELYFAETHVFGHGSNLPLVLVLNNGDFGRRGTWAGELSYPTRRPVLASWYLFRRYVLPHSDELPPISHKLELDTESWQRKLESDLKSYPGSVSIVVYADQKALGDRRYWLKATKEIRMFVDSHKGKMRLYDASLGWNPNMYRDNVHPNSAGIERLAGIVALACRRGS